MLVLLLATVLEVSYEMFLDTSNIFSFPLLPPPPALQISLVFSRDFGLLVFIRKSLSIEDVSMIP